MSQLFSNNAETTLGAPLTDAATSVTFADGSKFKAPTGGDYELLTLLAAGNIEIVRLTARTGNTGTITRAQEGTTARAWATGTQVFAGVTAGTLEQAVFGNIENETTETGSIVLKTGAGGSIGSGTQNAFIFGDGAYADLSVSGVVAIGEGVYAEEGAGVAVGQWSGFVNGDGVAVGNSAFSRAAGVAIGKNSDIFGLQGIAIGVNAAVYVDCDYGIAIGSGADGGRGSEGGIAIGYQAAITDWTGDGQIAIGPSVVTRAAHSMHLGALYTVPRGLGTEADAAWTMSAGAAVIMSEPLDLTGTLTHTIAIPSGLRFFVDEIGIVVVSADTVDVQPTMRFGITGTEAKFSAAELTAGLTAAHNRHRITSLDSADGVTTLRSEVTVAATATALTGRVYWRGFAVTDNA